MSNILNSYFVKTHKLEISITIIAIVLFLIYFFGATHVFTRFPRVPLAFVNKAELEPSIPDAGNE